MNKGWMKAVYLSIALAGLAALAVNIATHAGRDAARQEQLKQFPAAMQQPDRQVSADKVRIIAAYGRQPMGFEENIGQSDAQVKFMTRGRGYALFLTPDEVVLALTKQTSTDPQINDPEMEKSLGLEMVVEEQAETRVLRMRMKGANTMPQMSGLGMQVGKSNYIHGNDPKQWTTGVSRYDRVLYHEVYEGIDLAFYGNQNQLEYDFIVNPGASTDAIRLTFAGADSLEVDAQGNLILHLGDEQVIQHAPLIYQQINGRRQPVTGGYRLAADGEVAFEVASYDTTRPLIIDPVLVYSTYLGGSGDDFGFGIAVDAAGNAYVTGFTWSSDFPVLNAIQPLHGGGSTDAFVTKLDTNGQLVWSTYMGGSALDYGYRITVDSSGNAYVAGESYSTDFPTTPNVVQPANAGWSDAFITKLDTNGLLVWSTYLGGSSGDLSGAIAVDGSGDVYVTGQTYSTNFPTLNPVQAAHGGGVYDGFAAKLDATGQQLIWSTYLGGNGPDGGSRIAVDASANAYVTGYTRSSNFPTLNAMQASFGGVGDVFVSKFNTNGQLAYSTYLGGSGNDYGFGIAVDGGGDVYVTAHSSSTNFPTLNAIQPTNGGGRDVTVTRLDASGQLVWSTYLGGSSHDSSQGMTLDASGNIYVTGYTESADFPVLNAIQSTYGGGFRDAFIIQMDATGQLVWSTYLGGGAHDWGFDVMLDAPGNIYVAGRTNSTDFPTTLNAIQQANAGGWDAFVTKIGAVCVTPPSGMVSWWDGDAVSGTAVSDIIGSNHGALLNGATTAPGKVGDAFSLDGINDYVQAPYVYSGPFTVDLWVKSGSANQSMYTSLFSSGHPGHYDPFFQIDFDGAGNYRFHAGLEVLHINIGAATTNFQHVAVTYDGSLVRTYLNGVLQNSGVWTGATLQFEIAKIGTNRNVTHRFHGLIDEVEIFNRALTTVEIQSIYAAGSAGKCKTVINQPPVAVNDFYSTNEDTPLNVAATGVLFNDTDADGDVLTAALVGAGTANGSLILNADGSFSYAPNPNFNGSDSFTYKANDGSGDSNVATVTITVSPANDPPVAVNDLASTSEDLPVIIDVLGNDADVDGDTLMVSAVSGAASGTVTNNGINVAYTPNLNFNGADSFTYTVSDGNGGTATATVTITVTPVNDPPVALNDAATTAEDTAVTVDVLVNDSDVDGDVLMVSAVSGAANGAVTNNGINVAYTPNTNFNGPDAFTYTVSDGNGGTATAIVTITVTPVNDAPVLTLLGSTPVTIEAGSVYSDAGSIATDVEDGNITTGIVMTGTVDTMTVGSYTLTYHVTDSGGLSATPVTRTVNVVDSIAPIVTAELIPLNYDGDKDKDEDKDEPHAGGLFKVVFTASDIADANPVVTATLNGQAVSNGQVVKLERDDEAKAEFEHGQLEIKGVSFTLNVSAIDVSGNTGSASDVYAFSPKEKHHGDKHRKSKKHDKDD